VDRDRRKGEEKEKTDETETNIVPTITCCTFPIKKKICGKRGVLRSAFSWGPIRPDLNKAELGKRPLMERGIVTHVAHVEVEIESVVATAIGSAELGSSARGGSAGSTLLRGGEFIFERLATDNVGELVDCDCASGGVQFDPVECV
jgi:hypothetical protein